MPRKSRTPTAAETETFTIPGLEEFQQKLSWADVDPDLLLRAIEKITDRGDALILGHTSDGGAYALTLLAGDHKPRFWPASIEHANKVLTALCAWCDDTR